LSSEYKIVSNAEALEEHLSQLPRPFVFTNGCFDILHRGHVAYLERAAEFGKSLIVGVNTDASVRRQNKGVERPLNPLEDRMAVLAALGCVSMVVAFDEDTPLALIRRVHPDHLVKGGDWSIENIVGAREVQAWGGEVHSIPFEFDRSTSLLVEKIRTNG
jgi:rfaE bifunctional protein nucleotidyltransferase chain/domain